MLLVLPLVIIFVFQRSERATREWVGAGLDLDVELLELVRSEHFAVTRFGTYLQELRAALQRARRRRHVLPAAPGARAVGAGEGDAAGARGGARACPITDDLHDSLDEIEYLQRRSAARGCWRCKPLQVTSDRDRWHRYVLASGKI